MVPCFAGHVVTPTGFLGSPSDAGLIGVGMACTAGRTAGEEAEALFRLGAGHAAVEQVDDHHLQAEGSLQGLDLVDDLVRGADRLGGAARVQARVGHPTSAVWRLRYSS